MAGLSVHARHLDTAEVAYAAIQEADKVLPRLRKTTKTLKSLLFFTVPKRAKQ